jgi:nitrite reductase (NADH) large subunit
VSEPLVIVGNGMAAALLVDELTRCALARHAIAVIGDEPRLAYNRVLLSSVLARKTAPEDIELKPMSWWRNRGVTLKVGCPATEIDVGGREIKIANDESVSFSRLVLAEGSAPLRLNVSGADLRVNCNIPPISLSSTGSGIARISADVQRPASTR